MRSPRLWRRLLQVLLGVSGFLILLVAVILLNLDWVAKKSLTVALRSATGCEVKVGSVELGLRAGTFRLEKLVVSNPPGFGDGLLLDLPELFLEYDSAAAATNALHFKQVRLNVAELGLVVDAKGYTNFFALNRTLEKMQKGQTRSPKTPPNFTGIDTLTVSLGRFSAIDLRSPARTNIIRLDLRNEVLHHVRTVADLGPLLLKLLLSGALRPGTMPVN